MRGSLALLVATTACLSRPVGLPGDAGTGDGEPGHSEPWPVPGAVIGRTLARDANGDGILDLLVTSDRGVYVLGGGTGFGAGYHAFVATPFVPLALDVADVGGSPAPELAVLGVAPGGAARVELHEGLGAAWFAAAGWQRDFADLEPKASAGRGLWLLDSDGDGRGNVLVADANGLYAGEPAALTELGVSEMPLVQVVGDNATYFISVEDLAVLPGAGKADLVVTDAFSAWVYAGDGTDSYPAARRTEISYGASFDLAAHADLDGDGVPELVGGYYGFLEGVSLSLHRVLPYQGDAVPSHSKVVSLAARFGQLDRDAAQRPDLVLMRHITDAAGAPTDTELVLIRNLAVVAGNLTTTATVVTRVLPGLYAGFEVGDFDHDGRAEIIVVARDGALTCLRSGDNAFDPC